MSDAPDGPDEARGAKQAGDPGLAGATETGRAGIGHPDTGGAADDNSNRELPAEKGGGGGGGSGY